MSLQQTLSIQSLIYLTISIRAIDATNLFLKSSSQVPSPGVYLLILAPGCHERFFSSVNRITTNKLDQLQAQENHDNRMKLPP